MENYNIEKYFNSVVEAVDLLHQKMLLSQALTIIYSSIDACGLLNAPDLQEKSTGTTFKAWVEKYMLISNTLECSADDLWGARCAVLHTHSSISDLSKASKVREIQYISGPPEDLKVKAFIAAAKDIGDRNSIMVNIDLLIIDFVDAIGRFSKEMTQRIEQSEVCRQRASYVLQNFAL